MMPPLAETEFTRLSKFIYSLMQSEQLLTVSWALAKGKLACVMVSRVLLTQRKQINVSNVQLIRCKHRNMHMSTQCNCT